MNITDERQEAVHVELFTWMRPVIAKNNGKKYYMLGQLIGQANTLLVTLANGNGGAVMFCQTHSVVYPIKGKCEECRNAVVTVADEAGVTSCYTPEIERD